LESHVSLARIGVSRPWEAACSIIRAAASVEVGANTTSAPEFLADVI